MNLETLVSFRCSDHLHKDCPWQVSGKSEEAILPRIEQHGRERHKLMFLDEEAKKSIHLAVYRDAA